eukprot:889316-Amphidinium_carterae.1
MTTINMIFFFFLHSPDTCRGACLEHLSSCCYMVWRLWGRRALVFTFGYRLKWLLAPPPMVPAACDTNIECWCGCARQARPKSATLPVPFLSMRIFMLLTSR